MNRIRRSSSGSTSCSFRRCRELGPLLLLLIVVLLLQSTSTMVTAFTITTVVCATAATCSKNEATIPSVLNYKDTTAFSTIDNFMESDDDNDYDDDDDDDDTSTTTTTTATTSRKASRWESLNPRIKARIIKQGQERAIANKKKREPTQAKKRRVMMFVKEKQQERKKAARVQRPLKFNERNMTLDSLKPGMEVSGIVISLTSFGAYIDVGTECDGLLHVSQMSHTTFVEHPRQVVQPGENVTVRVRSTSPKMKKLHLSMLPLEILQEQLEDLQRERGSDDDGDMLGNKMNDDDDDDGRRIPLEDIQMDDELWGQIKRVTNFGAYVEVGAVVDGFLHFMDHPAFGWNNGEHPSQYMTVGDRVRVWAVDVDLERNRLKLTANRPTHLPGPKRELPVYY